MGTFSAVVLALLLLVYPSDRAIAAFPYIAVAMVMAFLVAFAIGNVLTATALQGADRHATPRIIGLFRRDRHVQLIHGLILFWSLFSIWLALTPLSNLPFKVDWILAVWLVFTGAALDLATHLFDRVLSYLNSFDALGFIHEQAVREIRVGNDAELCDWIEATSDAAVLALSHDSVGTCVEAVDSLRAILQSYLALNHKALRGAAADSDPMQRATYILYYAFDRLASLYRLARKRGLESVCNAIVSSLGKIAVGAAEIDLGLVVHPVHYLGMLSKEAIQDGSQTAGRKAMLTLVQTSKLILSDPEVLQKGLDRPFLGIVRELEALSKESFRKDKSTSISTLTAPVQDLKKVFEDERFANHVDVIPIRTEIDRVLGDFANLDLVLRAIPPIPAAEEPQSEV